MDVQFYGANCLVFGNKELRIVVDDTLAAQGGKSVTKANDVALFTQSLGDNAEPDARMVIDMPGEYEINNIAVKGIPARGHMDEPGTEKATMYKIVVGDMVYLVAGHIYPELTESELEGIGLVDVLFVPVGGNGYTMDPVGALKLTRAIDPKLVIPTHYDDKSLKFEVPQQTLEQATKEFGMEPKETIDKLRLKPAELGEATQLQILEKAR
jgi:L-ascorbate metabolism protein UlaG (beta-lactamase superfamily)